MTLRSYFLNNYEAGTYIFSVCIISFTSIHDSLGEVDTDQEVPSPFYLRIFNTQSSNVMIHKEIRFDLYLFDYLSEQAIDFKIQDFKTIIHYQLSILHFSTMSRNVSNTL